MNADALCTGCHMWFHQNPIEYREWKERQIGKSVLIKLEFKSRQYKKRDDKLAKIETKALLETLPNEDYSR